MTARITSPPSGSWPSSTVPMPCRDLRTATNHRGGDAQDRSQNSLRRTAPRGRPGHRDAAIVRPCGLCSSLIRTMAVASACSRRSRWTGAAATSTSRRHCCATISRMPSSGRATCRARPRGLVRVPRWRLVWLTAAPASKAATYQWMSVGSRCGAWVIGAPTGSSAALAQPPATTVIRGRRAQVTCEYALPMHALASAAMRHRPWGRRAPRAQIGEDHGPRESDGSTRGGHVTVTQHFQSLHARSPQRTSVRPPAAHRTFGNACGVSPSRPIVAADREVIASLVALVMVEFAHDCLAAISARLPLVRLGSWGWTGVPRPPGGQGQGRGSATSRTTSRASLPRSKPL